MFLPTPLTIDRQAKDFLHCTSMKVYFYFNLPLSGSEDMFELRV